MSLSSITKCYLNPLVDKEITSRSLESAQPFYPGQLKFIKSVYKGHEYALILFFHVGRIILCQWSTDLYQYFAYDGDILSIIQNTRYRICEFRHR
jgi:hypothetical protein